MPDASVKVICRFRPVNEREINEGDRKDTPQLEFPDEHTVVVKVPNTKPQIYQFDRVFWNTETRQDEIYELSAKNTINDIFEGYNGTIFAYGQTGAGKSFTMFGPDSNDEYLKGIIPRSCEHIFNRISKDESGAEFLLKCSFLEIYKESIRDLLDPNRTNLKVRETPSRGVWVQDLTEHFVASVEDIYYLLQIGEKSRATSSTKMNSVSSRSHSLFILTLSQKSDDGSSKEGKLNLADLAGSEKVGKTGATGDTLEEAKKINQSLSALGNCINALTKSKKGHVPYRDSRLTHILRESLGGNSKTTLIIACSPHSFNVEETISTLKFGQRAKSIKNNVKVNQQRSVKELEGIIENLTGELTNLKLYVNLLENTVLKFDGNFDFRALKKEIVESLKKSNDTNGSQPSTPSKNDAQENVLYNPMDLAEMKVKMEQMKEKYELEIQDLKDEIDTSNGKELEKYKNKIESLKASLKSEQDKERLLQAKMDYESQSKESLDSKLKDYENANKALEQKVNQLIEENETLTKEKDFTQVEFDKTSKNMESYLRIVTENESLISSLNKELQTLKNKYKKGNEKIVALEGRNKEISIDLDEMKSKLIDSEYNLEKSNKELALLESAKSKDTEDGSNLEKVKSQLSEEKKKNIHLNSDIRRRENDNKDLSDQIIKYKKQLSDAEERLKDIEDSKELDEIEFNEKESEYQDQIRSLKDSLQKESKLRDSLEIEKNKLIKKNKDYEVKLKKAKKSLEKSQNDIISSNETMTKQLSLANKRILDLELELEGAVDAYLFINNKYVEEIMAINNPPMKQQRKEMPRPVSKKNIVVPMKGGQSLNNPVTPEKTQYLLFFNKTTYPSIDQLVSPVKTGWLWKRSNVFRSWVKKWYLLKGHYMYYFDAKDSDVPAGHYNIYNCSVSISVADEDKFPFILTLTDLKIVTLNAETDEERISWMNMIMRVGALTEKEALEYNPNKTPNSKKS